MYFCRFKAMHFPHVKHRTDLQADDIHAAEKYLASIGKSAVGVLGHSKGGSAVLIHSATYHSIPKVANISGRFNHKRGGPFPLCLCELTPPKWPAWRIRMEKSQLLHIAFMGCLFQ